MLIREGRANYEIGEKMCRRCRLVYTEDEKRCHSCGCMLAYKPRRGVRWIECSKCGHPSLMGRSGGGVVELAAKA